MIKINLSPYKKKRKKPKPVPGYLVICIILVLLSVIVTFYFNYFMKSRKAALVLEKEQNVQTISKLQERIQEVRSYEALNQKFKERKQIIEELKRNQARPVQALDELSARLSEGVWITSLSITGETVDLSGVGFTNDDVVTLVQNLKASQAFEDVYLHQTTQSSSDGVETYAFHISMRVRI